MRELRRHDDVNEIKMHQDKVQKAYDVIGKAKEQLEAKGVKTPKPTKTIDEVEKEASGKSLEVLNKLKRFYANAK